MDKALKQRLVGASVLIILAVIVLPMLLSGRSDTLKQESRQIELPAKPDELSFETRRFPVGVPNKPVTAETGETGEHDDIAQATTQKNEADAVSVDSGNQDTAPQQALVTEEKPGSSTGPGEVYATAVTEPSVDDSSSTMVKPPAVTSITLSSGRPENESNLQVVDGSPDTPRYLVQVASFSSEKNANALASQLRAENLPVLMDVVDRTAGRLHRVRVGPFAERADADVVVSDLRSKMKGLSPRVLDLRPRESSPVSTPSDPLVRWVVQVGSFSNSKSAEALVAELRLAGLTAFSEKVSSAGSTAYKVRIGPEIDRDKAAELARKVKADHNLDGFVTTQE
jgi:cell division septation protein DedD